MIRHLRPFAVSLLLASAVGCAGGSPLLHPAHVLANGDVRFAAGSSAHFVSGSALDHIRASKEQDVSATSQPSESYVRGALAEVAFAPGLAPFTSARVGFGSNAEGGLSYTGRQVRVDARMALQDESFALSAGLAGSGLLSRRSNASSVPGWNAEGVTGWGLEVPVLAGWRSSGNVVSVWAGGRIGYEKLRGSVVLERSQPYASLESELDARHLSGGAVLGFSLGLGSVHAALEVQSGYHDVVGDVFDVSVDSSGWSVTPAGAILASF